MSRGYYRVDAIRPDQKAGGAYFVRGENVADAEEVLRLTYPLVADWELTTTRIKREEFPVAEPEVLILPPASEVVPHAHSEEVEEEYSIWSAGYIREQLIDRRTPENPTPRLLIQAPTDTIEEGNDSRDLVTLGHKNDEVVVIDRGVR